MYKLFCRAFQRGFWVGSAVLPWRRPKVLKSYAAVTQLLVSKEKGTVLVVTDPGLVGLNLHKNLLNALTQAHIKYAVYDKTEQNPTIENIEDAYATYKLHKCSAIIGLGGGSSIDCAKGVGARVARPGKTISQMRGLFKVLLPMPLFIAIPTTSGSGSETTVAAVITDSKTKEKYALNDTALIPHYVLHMPRLTVSLPPALTATIGMDALCHAVEAYIGHSNTAQTRKDALLAVRLIFANLYAAYTNGKNLEARAKMQKAAYLAGAAFTRAYVGNIHAISHTLSGMYGTPHGLANAVIMPYVLQLYGDTVHKPLSELAIAAGVADNTVSHAQGAKQFIDAICKLNADMGIPEKLPPIPKADMYMLAKRALREANPLYPVPIIFREEDVVILLMRITEKENTNHD